MTNIIANLLLLFMGDLLVLALTIFLIGCMFLLRVMLNIWFDTDFFKRFTDWLKKKDDKAKEKKRIREERARIREAESRKTWVIGDDDEL